jgi:hypothetical protein
MLLRIRTPLAMLRQQVPATASCFQLRQTIADKYLLPLEAVALSLAGRALEDGGVLGELC